MKKSFRHGNTMPKYKIQKNRRPKPPPHHHFCICRQYNPGILHTIYHCNSKVFPYQRELQPYTNNTFLQIDFS